jgi:hypothetical protein
VEHEKHNTDFFYALLVTEKMRGKTGLQRYTFKNYLMRRGDKNVYEIPVDAIRLIEASLVWPLKEGHKPRNRSELSSSAAVSNADLVRDNEVVAQFFPGVKALQSKDLGIYWRGSIMLADGSKLETVVFRDPDEGGYTVTLRNPSVALEPVMNELGKSTFSSARAALIATERACNAQLFSEVSQKRKWGWPWMF